MKLSAPPPPPPEPNDPSQRAVDDTPASPDTPESPESPESPIETTPPAPKALAWPAWFAGADFLLTVLVLALAFLVASFVARNSDVWLHLAAGQRLLAGEYSPGTDPFSFSATDRTWVNHSILFDVGAYLLYGGNGMLLVVLKALAVAGALGLVFALRRPGYSLWPWAGVGLVAVFAIAPYTHLRPVVGSMLLFSLTLFLLFRGNFRPGSWQFPVAIGVTFWVWANVDEWFFLGPLAVALVLAGELIQRAFFQPADGAIATGGEPLGSVPDVPTLAKALGIGIVACMLNPHHVGVWQLPLELTGARDLSFADPRFKQVLFSPLDKDYYASTTLGRAYGYTANGLAYAMLFVAGGAAVGLAGSRLRFGQLLLWVGFALLSLQTIHLIPFVALLAVPLVASQLNALSTHATLKTWGDPRSRVLLLGSGFGRVVVLIVIVVSCVRAWPGWMHPPVGNEAFARRVGWAVEPDAGMVRGAEEIQAWRSGERPRLAPETRGLILSLEFANYCAWFAPREKVYANSRYRHHRRELGPFTEVRKALELLDVPAERRPDPTALGDTLRELGAEYVVTHAGPADPTSFRGRTQLVSMRQWYGAPQWSPWYLDGRSTICGWRDAPGTEKPSFDAMKLDPLVLAFGPDVKKLPPGATTPVRPSGGWEESFLRSPRVAPPDSDQAPAWQRYKEARSAYAAGLYDAAWRQLYILSSGFTGGWLVAVHGLLPRVPDDEAYATPILALRAAYRAIADDPDHPDGYLALADALQDRELLLDDTVRVISRITALRQCLQRMPSPENYRATGNLASPFRVSLELANLYLGRKREFGPMPLGIPINHLAFQLLNQPRGSGFLRGAVVLLNDGKGRAVRQWVGALPGTPRDAPIFLFPLDETREMLQLAKRYLPVNPPQLDDKGLEEVQKYLDAELKMVEDELGRMNQRYEQRKFTGGAGQMKFAAQVEAALEYNLVGEAVRLLRDDKIDLEKEFGPAVPQVILSRIALELIVGRLEDASVFLDALSADSNWQKLLGDEGMRHVFLMLRHHKCLVEGNFAEAGAIIESLEGEFSSRDPANLERQQFDPKPYVASTRFLETWLTYAPLTALAAPTPHDLVARLLVPPVALGGYGGKPGFSYLQNSFAVMRQAEGQFYLRRGMLSLFEGDIKAARERFLQTRSTPEQKAEDAKWGLLERRYAESERYIRLIDRAAERARPK